VLPGSLSTFDIFALLKRRQKINRREEKTNATVEMSGALQYYAMAPLLGIPLERVVMHMSTSRPMLPISARAILAGSL
jgi:hypothetical protein